MTMFGQGFVTDIRAEVLRDELLKSDNWNEAAIVRCRT